MRDPYVVLGVAKSATAAEIKSAFRKLAKANHPDANRDDPKAQERFGEISRAYEIIGDADKRKKFDAGLIDADGREKAQFHPGGNPFANADGFDFRSSRGAGGGFDPEDILKTIFGSAGSGGQFRDPFGDPSPRRSRPAQPTRGRDIEVPLAVTVENIISGGKVKLKLPDGRTIAVSLPEFPEDGQVIRLKGQGDAGPAGHRGDVLATLRIRAAGGLRLEGSTIVRDVDLPLETAVNGGKVTVETPKGKVAAKVAPWTNSGHVLRLKGLGLPRKGGERGDVLAVLRIRMDDADRAKLEALFAANKAKA